MKPKSYTVQDGCWNCRNCFEPWNPECWEGYCLGRCSRQRIEAMYQEWRSPKNKRLNLSYLRWTWDKRACDLWGVCHKWKKRRKS